MCAELCLTLCDAMDSCLPGSSVHGFPSKKSWVGGLTFPAPGDLPNTGIKPASPALAGRFFTMEPVKAILRNISILNSTSFLEKSWFSEIFLLVFIVPNQAARYNCFYSRKRTFALICNFFSTSAALFKKNHCNYSIFNNRIRKKTLILFNMFYNLLLIYVFFVQ